MPRSARIPRVFTDQPLQPGEPIELEADAARHIALVLRLQPGMQVIMFNGDGRDYRSEILRCGKPRLALRILAAGAAEAEPAIRFTLYQGVAKRERMDWLVQKAVELGVHRIIPLFCSRTVVRLQGNQLVRRHEHWERVVISACEQSGRRRIPTLEQPRALSGQLARMPEDSLNLVLSPGGETGLGGLPPPTTEVGLLVGPEGGFDSEELTQIIAAGFRPIRLGPRILRTETASLAALAAMQTLWGDYRN